MLHFNGCTLLNSFDAETNLVLQNDAKKSKKMTENLEHGYSSESTQRELSNEYQHCRV